MIPLSRMYFITEALGVLIILILLYANAVENRQSTKKRKVFTQLLIVNAIVVAADAVSWIDLEWEKATFVLGVLVALTYIVPFLVQAIFTRYLYEHIAAKTKVNKKAFDILIYYSAVGGIIVLILCACGKMFEIRDGLYYPGSADIIYYPMYIISLLYLFAVIIANSKKLGIHDTIAAASFCLIPLVSIILSAYELSINLEMPAMALDMLVIYVMLQAERESTLLYQANVDELTGVSNRRAYEDDLAHYPSVPTEPDFVYASIDINGLKQVNDTLGHATGDELIRGASLCMKRAVGSYGKIYRTGGDEFVSMFFADENRFNKIVEDLGELTNKWVGSKIDYLSVSDGYASKREFPDATVAELAKIADERMYREKERYYANKGVDRKGQNEAHKVLCSLYTKILKINITHDSFSIINMDMEEQNEQKGYADSISAWLEGFGRSGLVHPDDLEDYLAKTNLDYMRSYFRRGKTSLTLAYRRKYGDIFKRAMMEIIPTKEYKDDDQSLYLYVKNIDI